jgi:uncharacterized membrane protein YdjX (TVP38/TMEM64 family)
MAAQQPVPLQKDPLFWIGTAAGILLLVVFLWFFDLKWLHDWVQQFSRGIVFALAVVLPLAGVPVTLLYAACGARFGHLAGLILVAAIIALHLLGSWFIANSWLKQPLSRLLKRFGRRPPEIPSGARVPVCLLVALTPGISYALKNYLLALAGVPFRQFFWTLLPAHFFHATLAILFGDFTGAMTTPRVLFLAVYAVVLIGLSHLIYRRLRPAAADVRRRAS